SGRQGLGRGSARRRRVVPRLAAAPRALGCIVRGAALPEEEGTMAAVEFERVSKVYADGTTAVHELELGIEDGEFMVLVGPSGCGKTTAPRMVAGLEDISSGVVRIGDRVVNYVPSRDRDI